jgi:hypothetical protein
MRWLNRTVLGIGLASRIGLLACSPPFKRATFDHSRPAWACGNTTSFALEGSDGTSQRKRTVAVKAPRSCATIKPGASTGRATPTLAQGLVERAAFRDIFEFAKTLDELTDEMTSGLERARENAHALAQHVVAALKAIQQENHQ